jgi:Silicon transporter
MTDPFQMFKYVYSTILLIFSLVLILGVVFTRQTHLSKDVHPALAIVVLVITISWLTMVEGGQGALVGLTPVDPVLYEKTHKWTRMCTKLVYTGDNLDRYLLGRQFMVILIVFSVEMSGAATEYEDLWGLPTWLSNIFLVSGLAMILFTCMVGQLNSEINGCHCMLDYRTFLFLMALPASD